MIKKIDPDLFTRLMKLSSSQRTDLLEFLGQTSLSSDEVLRLSFGGLAQADSSPTRPTGKS